MNIPSHQTCIAITAAGGPKVLQARRISVPTPGADEVLIEVHASGVNRHDCNQRARGPVRTHSDIPGLEVAGVVVSKGDKAHDIAIGARVCALTDGGGYAQYVVAKAGQTLLLPDSVDFQQGASIPEGVFTTWHNFFGVARLKPGETVLLHGGTSGVGVLAIQILSQLGYTVFATCGSDEKVAIAERLGAVRAFNYRQGDFVAGLKGKTAGRGVDIILDMSGGKHSESNIAALAHGGRLVHLSGGGATFQAPLSEIMRKEIHITGSLLRPLPNAEKNALGKVIRQLVMPLISNGLVVPLIYGAFSLDQASAAHALMEMGVHSGKIVLSVDTATWG